MELYIGGYAQGKRNYVLEKKGNLPVVFDTIKIKAFPNEKEVIFDQFQTWFLDKIKKNENPEEEMNQILKQHPNLEIICNEVGNGIVPMDALEREYRERLGRYLCQISKEATQVERIFCGIGQRIK